MSLNELPTLPEGLVAVVKKDCPTCELIIPVLIGLEKETQLTVFTQDDPDFPAGIDDRQFDEELAFSWHHNIETVPTLLAVEELSLIHI